MSALLWASILAPVIGGIVSTAIASKGNTKPTTYQRQYIKRKKKKTWTKAGAPPPVAKLAFSKNQYQYPFPKPIPIGGKGNRVTRLL